MKTITKFISAQERARQAYGIIAAFGWDISWRHEKPVPDDAWPIDIIAAALTEAKEEMQERAAQKLEMPLPMLLMIMLAAICRHGYEPGTQK